MELMAHCVLVLYVNTLLYDGLHVSVVMKQLKVNNMVIIR
jgi:hypothetical protein